MSEPKHKTIKVWFSTYRELKKLAAEKPESLAALIDRLVQGAREQRIRYDGGMRERTLIAHIQALIAAHHHPHMYDVSGVIADAEEAWKKSNEELRSEGF